MEEASHSRSYAQSSCSASGAASSQPLWGCVSHTALCWGSGWLGKVKEAEGKAGRWSDTGAEASLTLFPAAASAISI